MAHKRILPTPRKMDDYLAVGIAEGFEEATSHDEWREAWQYLANTGLAWKLQGWFGRTAENLIGAGTIYDPRIAENLLAQRLTKKDWPNV